MENIGNNVMEIKGQFSLNTLIRIMHIVDSPTSRTCTGESKMSFKVH